MKRFSWALIFLLCFSALAGCTPTDEELPENPPAEDDELTVIFPEEKNEIVFTAVSPFYPGQLQGKELYVEFENDKKEDGYDVFAEFTKYYRKKIRGKVNGCFYLLNPGDGERGWLPHLRSKSFCLFADEGKSFTYKNPFIVEYIMLRDKSLVKLETQSETQFTDIAVGGAYWNVILDVVFAPVQKNKNEVNYYLEFGNNNDTNIFETYVNIYREETCIATCYYETQYVEITYQWFTDYFTKNLVLEN